MGTQPRCLHPQLEDCTLQISPSGHYLDLDLSLLEQKDDLEGFYEEVRKGRRPTLILRTQLSVRVHAIIEKLYNSRGPELRRSLFSLKQLFQEDKDLVPEFVNLEGLTCLIKSALKLEDDVEEPPSGGRKERRRTDEGRRGWRSQGGSQDPSADAQPLLGSPDTPKEPPAEDNLPIPAQSSPAEREEAPSLHEDKPILKKFEARFLENLAAAQKEKISSMAKGRLDVLSDTTLEHPTALAWEKDHGTSDPRVEPPSIRSHLPRSDITDSCSTISSDTKFMLDMLYAKGSSESGREKAKKKRTVKLFWKELKQLDGTVGSGRFGQGTLWASLQNVEVNTAKLEHLFESRSKEAPTSKKAIDGKKVVVVLDPKRSNAINIGLTVLPPVHIIKTAVLNFDEFAVSKEGIEKILTMVPTEEEKQKIQEAQLANPDVPLGSAEQFLLSLSSISDLTARLQLWAFKLDYESLEQEIAEPLFDLKVGMEQLARNHTFKCILATLLAMGNFLNGSQSRGFDLGYLAKVSEVKDTVHRQSLLYHLCQMVLEKFPETTDLYSEIASITRSAKIDFEELANSLVQLERRCRASWHNLKVIAKHETKPVLKTKLTEFLKDSTQRIIVLKVVHRRVLNRFHSFLLYLGYPASAVRDVKVTSICKLLQEFALEYRTCWERVLLQQKKRAAHRERNKTRGRLITETEKFSGIAEAVLPPAVVSSSPREQMEAGHECMKIVLTSPTDIPARRSRASQGTGHGTPTHGSPAQEDVPSSPDDASDEIMDQLVKSVTHNPNPRPCPNKERRRSRGNRKSLRRTLKSGLTEELVRALGLGQVPGMEI
ncbi:hypothetical protein EK904_006173 [Melospiza melodia maxima]|nr:hypothetical protein EK904_006173 [Melospiza melodia maxima]